MLWSEERRKRVIGETAQRRTLDELTDVSKEVLDVLRAKNLMLYEARTVLETVKSALDFAPLP